MVRGMKKWVVAASLVVLVGLSKNVFGYIDPGTGASLIGSISPVIVAFFSAMLAFFVKHFWNPIKGFFLKLFKKGK
jgi:hypothetical protein